MFSRSRDRERPVRRFEAGRVGYAIGDIHGRADLLERMLTQIEKDVLDRSAPRPVVVFLGDYVDRGPESRRVLDLLTTGRPWGCEKVFLKGNHEAAMLEFLKKPIESKAWFRHGGLDTLVSYGVAPPPLSAREEEVSAAAEALAAVLPGAHLEFLNRLELMHVAGDYCFVHAGVDPGRPIDQQDEGDLLWIRGEFLEAKGDWSHCVVHGHTPAPEPHADARRIGVDTGAYASGRLTAVRLEDETVDLFSVRV